MIVISATETITKIVRTVNLDFIAKNANIVRTVVKKHFIVTSTESLTKVYITKIAMKAMYVLYMKYVKHVMRK